MLRSCESVPALLGHEHENLVKGLNRQTMNLFEFRLSFHMAGFLSR